MSDHDGMMPLTSHLAELRKRLVISFVAIFITTIVSYIYSEELFNILAKPLISNLPPDQSSLAFIGITDPFFTYLKVSIASGIICASPVILYQIWSFVAPGLHKNERIWFWPVLLISIILFVVGVLFAYLAVFHLAFKYLLSFANDNLRPVLSMSLYFSTATRLLIAFGFAFELPLFMVTFAKLGIVDAKTLKHYRRYAFIIAFVFGALLTPPDIISQVLLALPLVVLYEIGLLMARIFGKKKEE